MKRGDTPAQDETRRKIPLRMGVCKKVHDVCVIQSVICQAPTMRKMKGVILCNCDSDL